MRGHEENSLGHDPTQALKKDHRDSESSGDLPADMAQMLAAVETGLFGRILRPIHIGRFEVTEQLGRGGMGVV